MNSHEMAKRMLEAPDAPMVVSIDICLCKGDGCDLRAMGDIVEINSLPQEGGRMEVQLLAEGSLNYSSKESKCKTFGND